MSTSVSLNNRFDAVMRQHDLMFWKSLVPPTCPNLAPMSIKRCSKCQGFAHTSSDCFNKEFITLVEWEAAMKEENEEKNEDERDHKLAETQEKVVDAAREKELLVLGGVLSLPKGLQGEPSNPLPTHSKTKKLTQKFCHLIPEERPTGCDEPLLQTPNSELKAFEEMAQSKIEESPTSTIQTSKRKDLERVSKIKRDLFAWLILF